MARVDDTDCSIFKACSLAVALTLREVLAIGVRARPPAARLPARKFCMALTARIRPPVLSVTMTECEYHHTTLQVKEEGIAAPILFCGDGVWQWGLGVPSMSEHEYRRRRPWLRSHGTRICWAEWLHDGMEGWHTCVLYTGDTVAILPHHSDYPFVSRLVALAGLPERDVIMIVRAQDLL